MRRKGELSRDGIDSGWPHQVALPASACEGGGYKVIHEFCSNLSFCPRGHHVFHGTEWFHIYCFARPEDADKFLKRFGGERFNPQHRGRGSNWARWNKP